MFKELNGDEVDCICLLFMTSSTFWLWWRTQLVHKYWRCHEEKADTEFLTPYLPEMLAFNLAEIWVSVSRSRNFPSSFSARNRALENQDSEHVRVGFPNPEQKSKSKKLGFLNPYRNRWNRTKSESNQRAWLLLHRNRARFSPESSPEPSTETDLRRTETGPSRNRGELAVGGSRGESLERFLRNRRWIDEKRRRIGPEQMKTEQRREAQMKTEQRGRWKQSRGEGSRSLAQVLSVQ